ncbi:MAG: aspartate aminotransferase family protein [Chloroflexota bacterium]|nr:aspartate aminotransferase family protein [Chloroflexota bacterium]
MATTLSTDAMMDIATIREIENGDLVPLYAKRDVALVRGQGATLWDSDGKEYLDCMSAYGTAILGHAHPAVTAAITRQAATLTTCHQSFYNDQRARYLALLMQHTPPGITRAFFCNSGTESVEAALKFARAVSGRQHLVATRRAYHGRTMGSLAVTGDNKYREAYAPMYGTVTHVNYGDPDSLAAITDETAALIIEPIQGEGGIHPAPDGYLRAVREACDAHGALLIFDEVQTAFRTGAIFRATAEGVTPDIIAVSKAVANGLPMGLTLMTEAVAMQVPPGTHGNTFGGNPLVCAAAHATLSTIITDGLLEQSAAVGEHFLAGFRALDHPAIRDVRGRGLMIGVELKTRVTPVLRKMQDAGVLALPAGNLIIRFLPPLILTTEQADHAVAALGQALG